MPDLREQTFGGMFLFAPRYLAAKSSELPGHGLDEAAPRVVE